VRLDHRLRRALPAGRYAQRHELGLMGEIHRHAGLPFPKVHSLRILSHRRLEDTRQINRIQSASTLPVVVTTAICGLMVFINTAVRDILFRQTGGPRVAKQAGSQCIATEVKTAGTPAPAEIKIETLSNRPGTQRRPG
jgi:hypothetical protein